MPMQLSETVTAPLYLAVAEVPVGVAAPSTSGSSGDNAGTLGDDWVPVCRPEDLPKGALARKIVQIKHPRQPAQNSCPS
jgi:hypothetical protein